MKSNILVLRVGSIAQIAILFATTIIGIYKIATTGHLANEFTWSKALPDFRGIKYIPVIIMCCLGFEAIGAISNKMEKPVETIKKQYSSAPL
jgi:hypothetical protein